MQITLKVPEAIRVDAAEIADTQIGVVVTTHAVLVAALALGISQIQDQPEMLLVGLRAVEEARWREKMRI